MPSKTRLSSILDILNHAVRSAGPLTSFLLIIVCLLLVKLPPFILDLLLTLNILLAFTVLLRGVLLGSRERLYAFPAILVLATLFRLALNVSSTKLILLDGDQGLGSAGSVIESFGSFVVRGDFLVGTIVFIIIAVVNFVVIAKGSARVAEVAARFNLDALPGRQLSIDSDLRAGIIDAETARKRREELDQSSQFFGSMDGAMRWVQGDAVAGLVITGINAVGGVSLGIYRGLGFSDSVNTFGILTIGDGLVSILPSLLISVAAGIIVTESTRNESSSDSNSTGTAGQIGGQLFGDPRAILLASFAFTLLGLTSLLGVTNLPWLPFLVVSGFFLAWILLKQTNDSSLPSDASANLTVAVERHLALNAYSKPEGSSMLLLGESGRDTVNVNAMPLVLKVDAEVLAPNFSEELGQNSWLLPFAETEKSWSRTFEKTRGFRVPAAKIIADSSLLPLEYRVEMYGRVVRRGRLKSQAAVLQCSPILAKLYGLRQLGEELQAPGFEPFIWTDGPKTAVEALEVLGAKRWDPAPFLALEAVLSVYSNPERLLSLDSLKRKIELFKESNPALVSEVLDTELLSYAELSEVFRRLVRDGISVGDLKSIFSGILEFATSEPKDEEVAAWLENLHSFLRLILIEPLLDTLESKYGSLTTYSLSEEVESEFRDAMRAWDSPRKKVPLDPAFEQSLEQAVRRLFSPIFERGVASAVVLCPDDIRSLIQEFIRSQFPFAFGLYAIGYGEFRGKVKTQSVAVIRA